MTVNGKDGEMKLAILKSISRPKVQWNKGQKMVWQRATKKGMVTWEQLSPVRLFGRVQLCQRQIMELYEFKLAACVDTVFLNKPRSTKCVEGIAQKAKEKEKEVKHQEAQATCELFTKKCGLRRTRSKSQDEDKKKY